MQNNIRRPILVAAFFWLGFTSIIAQTISLRESLVIFNGNELIIGLIFAVWLLGIAIGAIISGYLADKIKNPPLIFAIVLAAVALILPCQVYFIRIVRYAIDIPIGQQISFFQSLYLSLPMIMPFSLLIGIAFPLACHTYSSFNPADGSANSGPLSIGKVYIIEALGSLVGGCLFTFLLVDSFPVFQILLFCQAPLMALAFWLFAPSIMAPPERATVVITKVIQTAIVFVALFVLIISAAKHLESGSLNKRWQSFCGKDISLLKSVDSKYANIAVGKLENQYSLVENGKFVSTFPDEYTYAPIANLVITQHPNPKNVLVIGGGIEGMLKEMLKYPITQLDYVQLDYAVIETLKAYLPEDDLRVLRGDSKIKIHNIDGRAFVKKTKNLYDIIFINLPDPSTSSLNRFYTLDFYREAKTKLSPDGILAARASSAVNYVGEAVGNFTGSVYDTLCFAFKHVLVTPGTEAFFFASDDLNTVTFDIKTLDQRYRQREVETGYFVSPASFEVLLPPKDIEFINSALRNRATHRINTDLQPITYFQNLVLWNTVTGGNSERFLKFISKFSFNWMIVIILLLTVFGILYFLKNRKNELVYNRFNTILSISLIGLSGLSLELILLFSFQNIFGYIYHQIGFLIALFMAGLAGGSYLSNRIIAKNRILGLTDLKPVLKTVIIIHLAMAILAFGLPLAFAILSSISGAELTAFGAIMLLIIAIGVLTGMVYPLLSEIYISSQANVGRTAGIIDSFDHLGACVGAFLTGILFIPVFGLAQTCIIIGLLNLLPAIFIAINSFFSYKGTTFK